MSYDFDLAQKQLNELRAQKEKINADYYNQFNAAKTQQNNSPTQNNAIPPQLQPKQNLVNIDEIIGTDFDKKHAAILNTPEGKKITDEFSNKKNLFINYLFENTPEGNAATVDFVKKTLNLYEKIVKETDPTVNNDLKSENERLKAELAKVRGI